MRRSASSLVCACGALVLSVTEITPGSAQGRDFGRTPACDQQREEMEKVFRQAAERHSLGYARHQSDVERSLGALSSELRKSPELSEYLRCLSRFVVK